MGESADNTERLPGGVSARFLYIGGAAAALRRQDSESIPNCGEFQRECKGNVRRKSERRIGGEGYL